MRNQAYTVDSPGLLSGALLNCRTVIEGGGCVATGMLSYMEGDMIDIELPQFENFELGEQVKVTIYSGMGIVNFFTKIIARNEGSLLLIHPPQQQQRFTDKRESPRITIHKQGFIYPEASLQENPSATPSGRPIHLIDISLSGVGFILDEGEPLREGMWVEVELQLGFILTCRFEIVRRFRHPEGTGTGHRARLEGYRARLEGTGDGASQEGMGYGARLECPDEASLRSLRAFILREQITAYVDKKQNV